MEINIPESSSDSVQVLLQSIPEGLRRQARAVHLAQGSCLFRAGVHVRAAFLVLSGEVRLARTGFQGVEVTLQRSSGGFIAEASLDSKVYHCDAVATASSDLLAFPAAAFKGSLAEDLAFSRRWQSILANEVRKLRAQCERLCLRTAEERILHYIEAEGVAGAIELRMTKKAWATELGLTHEALYRALRRLQDAGTLAVSGQRLALLAARSGQRQPL
jgi:CRP-like cAMP-binding protein